MVFRSRKFHFGRNPRAVHEKSAELGSQCYHHLPGFSELSRKFALGHKGISPFTQRKMLLRFLLLALFILDLTNNYDLLLEFFITISVSAVPQTLVKSTSVAYIVHRIPLHENSPQGKPYHSSTRNKKYYCIVLIVEQYDCVAVANNTDIQEYVQSLKKLTCQSYNRQKKVSMPQGRKVLIRYVK